MLILSLNLLVAQQVGAKSSETRGFRNNNPTNIIKTNIDWLGEKKCKDRRFECFESPEKGLRAAVKVLDSYIIKYKIIDISGIISRWSPKNENNTTKLITDINRYLSGFGVDTFDAYSSIHRTVLLQGIILFENGSTQFNEIEILEVIDGSSRIIDYGNKYYTRWDNGSLVSVNRSEEATESSQFERSKARAERGTRGQTGDRATVDKTCNILSSSWLYYRLSQIGRPLRYTSNLRVDNMGERLLVLYGRKGYSPMALSDVRWYPNNPPRYPPRECNHWSLFWRESSL